LDAAGRPLGRLSRRDGAVKEPEEYYSPQKNPHSRRKPGPISQRLRRRISGSRLSPGRRFLLSVPPSTNALGLRSPRIGAAAVFAQPQADEVAAALRFGKIGEF